MISSLFSFSRAAVPAQNVPSFSFQNAFDEHVHWKLHFETALRTEGIGYNARQVLGGVGTTLAAWLDKTSSSDPSVGALRQAFGEFHAAAAEALDLTQSGDPAAAHRVVTGGTYLRSSQRIKRLLVDLEKRRLRQPLGFEMAQRKVASA